MLQDPSACPSRTKKSVSRLGNWTAQGLSQQLLWEVLWQERSWWSSSLRRAVQRKLFLAFVCGKWSFRLESDAFTDNYGVSAVGVSRLRITTPAQLRFLDSHLLNTFCDLHRTMHGMKDVFRRQREGRKEECEWPLGAVGEHQEGLSWHFPMPWTPGCNPSEHNGVPVVLRRAVRSCSKYIISLMSQFPLL